MKTEYHLNDKLLCIENYDTNAHTLLYEKNKYYTITHVSIFDIEADDQLFEVFNKHAPLFFNTKPQDTYYIKKYFLSVTEQRKLKLNKISKL